jgi:hypothetical protein
LQNAAHQLAAGQATEDSATHRLLKNIASISPSTQVLFSESQDAFRDPGLTFSRGHACLLDDYKPSGLQNPQALIFVTAIPVIHQKVVMPHLVTALRFFHSTCKEILDGLLQGKSWDLGVLGDVSNYFGSPRLMAVGCCNFVS